MLFMTNGDNHDPGLIIFLDIIIRFDLVEYTILAHTKLPRCDGVIAQLLSICRNNRSSLRTWAIIPLMIVFRSKAR